jgi:lysyl-tRNA synthetase class 2
VQLAVGQLVVLETIGDGVARVVEVAPPRVVPSDGEVARFARVGSALAQRHRALAAVRAYFEEHGFLEVETPVRVPAPNLDANVVPLHAEGGFLITSPEHHLKRLLVGGLPRVFQIARCSRSEELGPWHEPEFTLVEWYRSFVGFDRVMSDTEELVCRVAEVVRGRRELRSPGGSPVPLHPPFERCTVREAFLRFAGIHDAVELAQEDEDRYFQLYVDHVEPGLAGLPAPVFLTEFPATQAALARLSLRDPTVAERFELCFSGVELCNGYGELTDPVEQRRRFEIEAARRGPGVALDEAFLAALEEGLPPCAGNALGFDRLLALSLGVEDIQQVVAFPACVRRVI